MSNKYSFIAVFVVVVVCSRIYAQTFNCPALGGATGLNCKEGSFCCGVVIIVAAAETVLCML